ncbi:MAG: hypothetical protein AAF626_01275 [Pseudomonadota bacterium]
MTAPIRQFDAPEPIASPDAIVAHAVPGDSERLLVVCSGLGAPSAPIPAPEFVDLAVNGVRAHAMFLADPKRSWMNAAGVAEAMVDVIERYSTANGVTEVAAIGHSMGGFAAIQLANLMPISTVLAFAPQFSMDAALVPEEQRWRGYGNAIGDWRFRDIGSLAAEGTRYVIVHGSNQAEAAHWMRFPHREDTVDHYILAGQAHNLAAVLVKRQIMGPLVRNALVGKRRAVRSALEKSFLGRRFSVRMRGDYMAEHPELTLVPGGAPVIYPEDLA